MPPKYAAEEIYGVVSADGRKPFELDDADLKLLHADGGREGLALVVTLGAGGAPQFVRRARGYTPLPWPTVRAPTPTSSRGSI